MTHNLKNSVSSFSGTDGWSAGWQRDGSGGGVSINYRNFQIRKTAELHLYTAYD